MNVISKHRIRYPVWPHRSFDKRNPKAETGAKAGGGHGSAGIRARFASAYYLIFFEVDSRSPSPRF